MDSANHKEFASRVLNAGLRLRNLSEELARAVDRADRLRAVIADRNLTVVSVNFSVTGHGMPDAGGSFVLPADAVQGIMDDLVEAARGALNRVAWQAPGAPGADQ